MVLALVVLSVTCALGLAISYPKTAFVVWILALETSPDSWLDHLIGGHETIIAVMKALGLVLAGVAALRWGMRRDRYNPGFAFAAMFAVGLIHGLYPGLTILASLRSLMGSAGPFLFSFVRLPVELVAWIKRAAMWGPAFTVVFGVLLVALGLDHMYVMEQGGMRFGASGEPPFLAGFALVGLYAALLEYLRAPRWWEVAPVLLNLAIILTTGARVPLALAVLMVFGILMIQRRVLLLAAVGALVSLVLMFMSSLRFIRVIDLVQLGETFNLSNRDLVWPYFASAIERSPWCGWGVGAGKVVIPLNSPITAMIGTNAAHDEYLRIGSEGGILGLLLLVALMFLWVLRGTQRLRFDEKWLMRLIFVGFIFHSATDNTLIATTSSVFFIWVSAVFATGAEGPTSRA